MPPLHPAATTPAATYRDIEAAHHSAPDNFLLMLRFVALKFHIASTMGTLRRQRHGDGFIHSRGNPPAGVLPIGPARLAARAFGVVFGFAAGMWCGLALCGSQGYFQLLAQSLNFLLEPFNLQLLFFDLLLGAVQLSLRNKFDRIRLPSTPLLASRGFHPLYSSRNGGFCPAPVLQGPILLGSECGK